MLDQREAGSTMTAEPLNFEKVLYGSFKGQVPAHYVFQGFESSDEFNQHLSTLLSWQVEKQDGLRTLGVESTEQIQELELSMAQLINAADSIKDF